MRPWDLQPLVLCHLNRFFCAARRVALGLDEQGLRSMLAFTGNMIWAHGSRGSDSPLQERSMAVVGGAMSALADRIDPEAGAATREASLALDALERELIGSMDGLLIAMADELSRAGLAAGSPAEISGWVWSRLFPDYPWPVGQLQLEDAIRARLS